MTVDNANKPHRTGAATRANERIHRAVSADGTEIAGRVQGHGPPLILVHGAYGDGEIAWKALLPYLTDRYTCYLPSTRGRVCPPTTRTTHPAPAGGRHRVRRQHRRTGLPGGLVRQRRVGAGCGRPQ